MGQFKARLEPSDGYLPMNSPIESSVRRRGAKVANGHPVANGRTTSIWTATISTAGFVTLLVGGVGSFAISTVVATVNTQRDDFNAFRGTVVTVREQEQYKETVKQALIALNAEQTRLRDRAANKDATISSFASTSQRFTDINSQLKELRDALGSSSSLKDVIATLQKQLDDLRQKVLSPAPAQIIVPAPVAAPASTPAPQSRP